MSTFLVLGGTGKVGCRLTARLRDAGHDARVASRSDAGDVRFDWHDPTTHDAALAGVDGVFVVGPGSASDWSPSLSAFLDRAQAAGVRHAVLLSARGVEFLPDGAVARAEAALRDGPVPWTILRPSHFAQNFTEAMFVPDADGAVTAPVGDAAHPFVDVADVAAVAASVLAAGSHQGETLALSGPAPLTFAAALQTLTAHDGRPRRHVAQDPAAHADALRVAGTPAGYVTWRMAMLDGIRRSDDAYVSDGVARVLGRPATSFEDFAAAAPRA